MFFKLCIRLLGRHLKRPSFDRTDDTTVKQGGSAAFSALRGFAACAVTAVCLWNASARAASVTSLDFSDRLAASLKTLEQNSATNKETEFAPALVKFYAAYGNRPLWITQSQLNSRATALQNVLAKAESEGLHSSRYTFPSNTVENLVSAEIAISSTFLRYVANLQAGRLAPRLIDPDLFVFERNVDYLGILIGLTQTADVASYLASLAPHSKTYSELKKKLSEYRSISQRGGWQSLPDGPVLKPGMEDTRVGILRARFSIGDKSVSGETGSLIYDPELVTRVQEFQSRMGLKGDGVIGKQTLSAMNVPVEARIQQIILNMERARWMPDDLGEDYIFVNVANFDLKAVSRGKTRLSMRAIVGKPYRRTPVFSEKLSHLELNPFWTVPPRIALLDLVPKLKQDKDYFAKQGITVYDGWGKESRPVDITTMNWSKYSVSNFPYRLRQEPGPENALGQIKFMLPNKFSVYLHDTSARDLFGSDSRAFSSGCVRVEKPKELAEFILENQPAWGRVQIDKAISSGSTLVVKVSRPVWVHLTYFTAWVDDDGRTQFREDIYGRDKRLTAALSSTLNK